MDFSRKTDVFVIGGGPAGLATAIAARRKGLTVTLADGAGPAIDKACGEGLMPATQESLALLGVNLPSSQGYRFRGIRFVDGASRVAADFPHGKGLGIRRTLLHERLVEAAEKSGVELLWKTPVIGIAPRGVQLRRRFVPARWIVGADGGHSRVRRLTKLDSMVANRQRFAMRRHYRVSPWSEYMELHWGRRVQGYVTPIAEDQVCVVMMGETLGDVTFERALTVLPELQERLAGREVVGRERGAVTAIQSLSRVWREHVALVGDASGGVDAITGEGLRLSFRQAGALAEAIERGDLSAYQLEHRRLAYRPSWMAARLQELARYDGLRKRILNILARNPSLFARLLSAHVGHSARIDIVTTGAAIGWEWLTS